MTKEQEDKIIAQAQDILERRLGVREDMKVSLRNVACYGAYYLGALDAVRRITEEILTAKPKGEDWIYKKAEWDCITKDKRSMQLYLDGTETRYRNHKKNKKGKLETCEMYFVTHRDVLTEVK